MTKRHVPDVVLFFQAIRDALALDALSTQARRKRHATRIRRTGRAAGVRYDSDLIEFISAAEYDKRGLAREPWEWNR
jgi:hypothetical protein